MPEKLGKSIPWLIIMVIFMMTVFGIWIVWQEVKASAIQHSVTVSNVAPTVGMVTLDGGTAITVVGNNYTTISGTTTVTDTNGWNDLSTTTALLYWNGAATSCFGIEGNYVTRWDTTGNGNGDPTGITTDGNYIWVVDYVDDAVYKYEMNGSYISSSSIGGSENNDCYGITTDGNYIWAADCVDAEVYKYEMDGTYISSWDTAGSGNADAMGITTDGNHFWITDQGDNEVYKYEMDGTYVSSWDTAGSGNNDCYGITTDGNYIWVIDNEDGDVYKHEMDGTYISLWDTTGSGNGWPIGITTDGSYFWVTDEGAAEVYQHEMDTRNPNWCYYTGNCTVDSTTSGSINYTCSAEVWFVAEPTLGTSSQPGEWQIDIKAVDASNASDTGTTSQDLNTLYYLDVSSSIDYSLVALSGTSSEQEINATNAGNAPIDLELSGEDMDDGAGHTISVIQQKYSSNSSMGDWQGTHLTTIEMYYDLNLPKPTETTTVNSTSALYWMMKIPSVQYSGTYTGTNTITACEDNQTFFCESASDYNSTTTIGGDIVYCGTSSQIYTPTAIVGGSATEYTWGPTTDEQDNSCLAKGTSYPACNYCDNLSYAGWADWELPSCVSGAQNSNCNLYQFGIDACGSYPCTPSWDTNAQFPSYWSSTELSQNSAWVVVFGDGNVLGINKTNFNYVRCVRGQ